MKRYLTGAESKPGKKPKKIKRVLLTSDGRSWVDIIPAGIAGDDVLAELIACKPASKGYIKRAGKLIQVPRTQAMYFHPYYFSGMNHPPQPETPPVIQRFLDWVNTTEYVGEDFRFNQVIGNWYENGSEYISAHSDDERQLQLNTAGETTILGANYGAARTVRFRAKTRDPGAIPKIDFVLEPGTAYVMGGTTNRTHTHEILKIGGKKGRSTPIRVSLTARCFNTDKVV